MPAGRSSGAARSFCGLVLVRKRLADGSYGWPKIPAFRAGRRARTARTKQERGPLAPAPALVLRALRARKTPPPRRAPLRYPAPPWSAGIRRPYGGCPGAQNGWGGHGGRRRFAAVGRPAGPPHGQPNKRGGPEAKGPGPALSGRFAPSRRPPGALRFPPTPKGNKKPGPMLTGAWPMKRCQERARQRRRSLGQSRCPCLTGSGGFIRPAAGYRRKPTAPASARLSPCA